MERFQEACRRADNRAGIVASILLNANRGKESDPIVMPDELFPLLQEEEEEKPEPGPNWPGLITYLKLYQMSWERKHARSGSDSNSKNNE